MQTTIKFNSPSFPVKAVKVVNSLEEDNMSGDISFDKESQSVSVHLRAYKIISLALHF